MKKHSVVFCCLMALAVCLCGCSNDDDEYESKLPTFSGIQFDYDVIYTDQNVVATAVQQRKGKLLDRTDYSWSTNAETNLSYKSFVIYDNDSANPTCSFQAPSYPGTFTLTFYGAYNVSGKAGNSDKSYEVEQGTVRYQYAPQKAFVTLTRKFRVVQRPTVP